MAIEKIIEKKQKELEQLNDAELSKMKLGDFFNVANRRESLIQQITHLQRYSEFEDGENDE